MGTDPGSIIIKIVTLFALIFVNAFFSMSEMAIVTLNDNKIDKMAEQGNKKAKQIKKLTAIIARSFLKIVEIFADDFSRLHCRKFRRKSQIEFPCGKARL